MEPSASPAASRSAVAGTSADMGRRGVPSWALEVAVLVTSACLAGEQAPASQHREALAWSASSEGGEGRVAGERAVSPADNSGKRDASQRSVGLGW